MVDHTKMGEDHCPHCKEMIDCASAIGGEHRAPDPGDMTICMYCSEILVYSDDMALVPCPPVLFESIPEEMQNELLKLQNLLRRKGKELLGDRYHGKHY